MFLLLNDYMILSVTKFAICLHRVILMLFQQTDLSCEIVVKVFIHSTRTLYTALSRNRKLSHEVLYTVQVLH